MSTSDVESFTGKIVCNIDGSSYIINAENATLSNVKDNSLSVAAISVTNEKTSASILQATNTSSKSSVTFNISSPKDTSTLSEITTSTTTISTATSTTGVTLGNSTFAISYKKGDEQQAQEKNQVQRATNPKIHTFRVVSANDANIQFRQENNFFKIQKPILMCFICKLSFGITKSFSSHASTEHGLDLQDLEKHLLMQREYSSAIIQRNMDENPQISFLEPVDVDAPDMIASPENEEFSGMEATQLENDTTKTTKQLPAKKANSSGVITVVTSASNAFSLSSTSTISSASLSSSSSSSSSSSLSPCTTNNNSTITTTSSTISIAPSYLVPVVASSHDDDQQSHCTYDGTIPTFKSQANTTTTTLSSNYCITDSPTDNLTRVGSLIPPSLGGSTSASSSSPAEASINTSTTTKTILSSAPSSSITTTTTNQTQHQQLTLPPAPPSSLALTPVVDLSVLTGNLAKHAISTDSLVNIHKYNNDNSNHDSIEPRSQDTTTAMHSLNLSPNSLHIESQQPTSFNTSIMSDFLQQHLQRLTAGRAAAEEDSQHKNLESNNMSWSQQTANTFSLPATASNASVAQISSLHASLAALNSEQNTSSVKLISKFLQHQLVAAQQQQQQLHEKQLISGCLNPASVSSTLDVSCKLNTCPEHADYKGIDCKTCEMLEATQAFKPSPHITPQRSPTNSGIAAAAAAAAAGFGLFTATNTIPMSPNHSLNANNLPSGLNVAVNTSPLNNPGNAASFTIGACSDHISGRPLGVECARCEMILNSARLNSNVQMSTRNSCKTLKCPQCNWHYKYQETLEIHMREKHPDGESACGYCLAGQQHPRLARGESYSCGYKPYRCEICNYSTTTKGNLSIHMQSDKHLNNMQELNSSQSMVAAAVAVASSVGKLDATPKINLATTIANLPSQQPQQQQQHNQSQHHSQIVNNVSMAGDLSTSNCGTLSTGSVTSNVGSSSSTKPKPSFRCDICSYETSVARNLRIHMTSEKHTHNMAVLQNNLKHIQALTFLQQQQQNQQQQGNNFMPEVAMADLAYNQALMIQLLHQNAAAAAAAQPQSQPMCHSPLTASSPALMSANKSGNRIQASSPPTTNDMPTSPFSPKSSEIGLSDPSASNLDPPVKPDLWPTTLFSCLICSNFNTNIIDELNQHLMIDRSRQTTPSLTSTRSLSPTYSNVAIIPSNSSSGSAYFSDIMIFQNNNYICRLCNYKTNLKANYQLHSKTDKHLQKLNFINHLREGGAANDYKLKYYQQQQQQIGANTVQIKCNCCDFYTNSIQKLSLHTQHMRHETMVMIFQHLNYLVQQQQHNSSSSNTDDSSTNFNSETAPLGLVDCSTLTSSAITTTAPSSSLTLSSSPSSSSAATAAAAAKPTTYISCNKCLLCYICNFKANSLLEMIQHVKSIRHLQIEQFVCLQRRSEQLETPSLDDVFKLCNKSQRNNDSTTLCSTITHTSNILDNKTSSLSTACFTNFIEAENEDFSNKMFSEQNEDGEINSNLENMNNLDYVVHQTQRDQSSSTTHSFAEANANISRSNIPAIIYKCNNCDFFGQLKQEVEVHHETVHPNGDSSDVISIPTNPVAIQAFQAAMAAATLAAVSRASKTSPPTSPSGSLNSTHTKVNATTQDIEDNVCPVAVKRERLDVTETEISHEDAPAAISVSSTLMEVIEQQDVNVQSRERNSVQCPLCQDFFTEKPPLETHLMTVHSVNKDGLVRLLLLVDTSMWRSEETSPTNRPQHEIGEGSASCSAKAISDTTITSSKPLAGYELSLCQKCGSSFKHEQQLLQHAQKMQHYTMQKEEYLCLAFNSVRNPCKMHFTTLTAMFNHYNDTHMRLVISERHVYKYRCKQCSLAFKTQEKLATHTLYHTMRDATKCAMCQRNFRSTPALQKHMEQTHSQTISSANNTECPSPRTVSPSGSETGRPITDTSRIASTSDKYENESIRSITPVQESCAPRPSAGSTQNEPHNLQMQHQQFQNLPALHNLQQLQQRFPQFAAAVAATGMPINPVEMLNLMQFHHLISLNFMNLAPPLIFAGNGAAAAASCVTGSTSATSTNMPNSNVSLPSSHTAPTANLTATSSSTPVTNINQSSVPALPNVEVSAQILQQQQQISPGASNSQMLNNQKRARTRITDDQLKILRAHFDINNSPSEESILEMSQKANLPMKVVKHWFRNTLFKERQRNKDSPYNFNNPPSTTLNLEEYERTGQAKVMPLTEHSHHQQLQIPSRPSSAHSISNISEYSNQQPQLQQQQSDHKHGEEADTLRSQASSISSSIFPLDVQIKTEPGDDLRTIPTSMSIESSTATSAMTTFLRQQQQKLRFSSLEQQEHDLLTMSEPQLSSTAQQQQHAAVVAASSFYNSYETKSESESSDIHSRPHTPNSSTTSNLYASMNDLLSQQLENVPLNQMGPPKIFQLNPISNPCINISSTPSERNIQVGLGATSSGSSVIGSTGSGGITVSSKLFEKHSPSAQYDNNSNSSNSSTTSSGKRANRTRFTDYQIKVLQEFFENNSYPKDSDLEYLSKLLLLSPRVIVVWFQNARQKQRKIYENQPNNSLYESEEKKQNINYACKKCSLVFQRYYELIRHQKNHCFKEENNKKSAKAQIAAAQIAQNLSSEDSNSSMDINSAAAAALLAQHHPVLGVASAAGLAKNSLSTGKYSPIPSNATTPPRDQASSNSGEQQKCICDKCKLTCTNFDQLREHQLMHLVNPNLHLPTEVHTTASAAAAVAAYGPFGTILQSLQQAAHLQQAASANSVPAQPIAKRRKYSETSSNADDVSSVGGFSFTGADYEGHAKKYNFLYQYFLQNEGNSDLRQQFHNQDSAELNMEYLTNYYQQTELKKRTSYDFLFQYYVRNEQQINANFELAETKPNLDFLLQYYQLCESKKFFQLEASPQRIYDRPLMQGGTDNAQHNTNASNSSNNSSLPASNGSDRSSNSSPGGCGINEESNGGGVLNNIENEQQSSLMATYNTEHKTRSNGQHCHNKESLANIDELNDRNFCQSTEDSERLNNSISKKLEEQMDQLDGLQEVNNQTNSNHAVCSSANSITAPHSPTHTTLDAIAGLGSYYQNLEDFLDASMIENHNQSLTFPTESNSITDTQKTSEITSISVRLPEEKAIHASNIPENSNQKQANKRLRTTILPEQLNFLYECYQNESNPSRKMLEEIAKKVNLKKRVVQVWFQNTRAKDKKSRNQHRQHFSNISDDNSNSSSMITSNNLKANISVLTNLAQTPGLSDTSNNIIRDCNLCQVTQVNIQQHAFTVEHIRKVKELIVETTAAAAANSLLQENDSDKEEKRLLKNCRDEQTRIIGDQTENVHQKQHIALMMMALQTQNMSNSMLSFNIVDDNSVAQCDTVVDETKYNSCTKHPTANELKKTKRLPIKRKKNVMKKTIVDKLSKNNENFVKFNSGPINTSVYHHYNGNSVETLIMNHCNSDNLDIKGSNYEIIKTHTASNEIVEDDAAVNEINSGNVSKTNCDSIKDNKSIIKSRIYNSNNTTTGK